MPAILISVLNHPRKRHATNLPLDQVVLVLAAQVLHGVAVEEHALVGQHGGHVDAQDGALDDEEAGQLDGVVDEDAEAGVAGFAGGC